MNGLTMDSSSNFDSDSNSGIELLKGVKSYWAKPRNSRSQAALIYYVHLKDRSYVKNVKIHVGVNPTDPQIFAAQIRANRLRQKYNQALENNKQFSLEYQKEIDTLSVFWFTRHESGLLSNVSSMEEANEIGKKWLDAMHPTPYCRYEVA